MGLEHSERKLVNATRWRSSRWLRQVFQWSKKSTDLLSRTITGNKSCVFALNPDKERLSSKQYINISTWRKHS
jgi:hypothetical protein